MDDGFIGQKVFALTKDEFSQKVAFYDADDELCSGPETAPPTLKCYGTIVHKVDNGPVAFQMYQ